MLATGFFVCDTHPVTDRTDGNRVPDTSRPVFLVGAERSGSTLLRLMLDSHPRVTCCEGFEFMVAKVGDDGARPSIEDYHRYLSTQPIFGSSQLAIDPSLGYDELVNDFFRQRLTASGKETVAAMVHMDIDRILHIWPEARFIHLIRDPRDVALSVIAMGWFGNAYTAIDKWIHAERGWDRLAPKLDSDRWIELQFADLISDHETQLRRVCDFLDVDYTGQMLSYADETDYGLPNPSRIGSWRGTMSDRDTSLVEGKVGVLLAERGFEPSGLEPIVPTGLDRSRLEIEGRLLKWKHRIDRFGLRLFIERGLARVIPIPSYRASVQLRFNAIERGRRKRSWRDSGLEFSVADDQR